MRLFLRVIFCSFSFENLKPEDFTYQIPIPVQSPGSTSQHGHHILFLPPYSPDLNPIEHDFANLKRQRQFAPPETALAEIIKCYGSYTE